MLVSRFMRFFALSAMAFGAVAFGGMGPLDMAADAAEKRKSYSISSKIARQIGKVEKAYAAGEYNRAIELVNEGLEKSGRNQFSRYALWRWMGTLHMAKGDTPEALNAYIAATEKALAATRKMHPESLEIDTLYSLSQAYFQLEDYSAALDYFKQWAPRDKQVTAAHFAYAAQIYYMLGNYRGAAKYIADTFEAVDVDERVEPRLLWSQIAVSSNWELGNYDVAEFYLQQQFTQWPDNQQATCQNLLALNFEVTDSAEDSDGSDNNNLRVVCSDVNTPVKPSRLKMSKPISPLLARRESADGCLPIVRVAPQYPSSAQKRDIEGYVIVGLDTKEDGWVEPKSVVVLEAEPKGVFDKAAVRAARKMRYKSEVLHGETQCRTGITYRFSFNLAK